MGGTPAFGIVNDNCDSFEINICPDLLLAALAVAAAAAFVMLLTAITQGKRRRRRKRDNYGRLDQHRVGDLIWSGRDIF